jgi:hypothetical protein
MRILMVALVLLNLAVGGCFIWANTSNSVDANRESLHSDRISLRRSEVTMANAAPANPVEKNTRGEAICLEWKGLPEQEFEHGREALRNLAGEQPLSVIEAPLARVYWVVFPPLPSRESALTKLGEIKALGIKEAFVITEEAQKNGISLGLFGNEELARRQVRELEAKGLTSLNIETRPKQGTGYYFVIKSEQPEVLKQLDKLRQTYPSTTLSRIDCHI